MRRRTRICKLCPKHFMLTHDMLPWKRKLTHECGLTIKGDVPQDCPMWLEYIVLGQKTT